jgi:hypothetical protein
MDITRVAGFDKGVNIMVTKKVAPKYPDIVVTVPAGSTPLRLMAAVSRAMRLRGVAEDEITKFWDECIAASDSGKKTAYAVAVTWVKLRS